MMDFYKRASLVCRNIPYGKVATYGQIALLCGMPRHARQVGYGLQKEKMGREVPAHRVVSSRGILTGAASFATFETQRDLLVSEGVEVTRTGDGWQVDLGRYGWRHTLSDAEEFRSVFEKQNI